MLREHLDLTGSKYGCGEGQCGACTVLIDGKAQRSCVTRVGTVSRKQITTIEGLAQGEQLHPVQQAFLDEGAMQCGYCTPGMIMSAVALVAEESAPDESEIIDFMDGNVCRCGTYPRIVQCDSESGEGGERNCSGERSEPMSAKTDARFRWSPSDTNSGLRLRTALIWTGAISSSFWARALLVVSVLKPAIVAQESGGTDNGEENPFPTRLTHGCTLERTAGSRFTQGRLKWARTFAPH